MKLILASLSNADSLESIKSTLSYEFQIDIEPDKNMVLETFSRKKYDFLLIDLQFLENNNYSTDLDSAIKKYWKIFPDADIIVVAPKTNVRNAVEAVKLGVSDYITYPLHSSELMLIIKRIEEKNITLSELRYLRNSAIESNFPLQINTKSPLMKEVFTNVRSVAETDSTVLLTGETGTGKGLIAKLIHQLSKRREFQFINIHCGAIQDTLLESELFGHEKGAFTGAIRRKLGKFEIADNGTIFLDEIGTISQAMQIKLLQVLQERTFYRVGGENIINTNVRIITATNSNLEKLTQEDKFRADLYYRLNVFQIEIPPLRKRLEDLEFLLHHILAKMNRYMGKNISTVHNEVMNAFREYEWPGNIRELENLIERAYILETTDVLTPKSFPIKLFKEKFNKILSHIDLTKPLCEIRKNEIERIEKEYLIQLLASNNGKINETSKQAGISERQLNNLMKEYNIHKEDFKK